jgi:hypothetical protein
MAARFENLRSVEVVTILEEELAVMLRPMHPNWNAVKVKHAHLTLFRMLASKTPLEYGE